MADKAFREFLPKLGLSLEVIDKLCQGNICSLEQLSSSSTETISALVEDSILINTILPTLQKYAFPILMAKDPYEHALHLLQRDASQETTSQAIGIVADAVGFVDRTSPMRMSENTLDFDRTTDQQNVNRSIPVEEGGETNDMFYSVEAHGLRDGTDDFAFGNVSQTFDQGSTTVYNISGGTHFQTNFGGTTVINNAGSTVEASSEHPLWKSEAIRQQKLPSSSIILQGRAMSTSNFFLVDTPNHWSGNRFEQSSVDDYERHLQDQTVYPIQTRGSCRALIINNICFCEGVPMREGAHIDTTNLNNTLNDLGFSVQIHKDKNCNEIKEILHEYTSSRQNNDCSVSFVFIGSHGERESHQDFFIDTQKNRMTVNDVTDPFTVNNCPSLNGKPKIFFFQFCRKDRSNNGTTASDAIIEPQDNIALGMGLPSNETLSDSRPTQESGVSVNAHNEADMLLSFATAAGTKAYRDTQSGSWFVTALCKVLQDHHRSEDLVSMLTMVNNSVMAKQGVEGGEIVVQMAEYKSTLTKKVKFFHA